MVCDNAPSCSEYIVGPLHDSCGVVPVKSKEVLPIIILCVLIYIGTVQLERPNSVIMLFVLNYNDLTVSDMLFVTPQPRTVLAS